MALRAFGGVDFNVYICSSIQVIIELNFWLYWRLIFEELDFVLTGVPFLLPQVSSIRRNEPLEDDSQTNISCLGGL